MTHATQDQIEAACMTRAAPGAKRHLDYLGLYASERDCRRAIGRMIASGQRAQLPGGGPSVKPIEVTDLDAILGCRVMLRRHLQTGRHWISDPARMADALRQAGMVRA